VIDEPIVRDVEKPECALERAHDPYVRLLPNYYAKRVDDEVMYIKIQNTTEDCVSGGPLLTVVASENKYKVSEQILNFYEGLVSLEAVAPVAEEPVPVKLVKPPGHNMLKLAEIVVSKKQYEAVFEPLVSDWRKEYFDALNDNREKAKIFFIHARYMTAFGFTCGLRTLWSVADKVHKLISKSA